MPWHRSDPPETCNRTVIDAGNGRFTLSQSQAATSYSRYRFGINLVKSGDIHSVNGSNIGILGVSEASYNHSGVFPVSITSECARDDDAKTATIDPSVLYGTPHGDRGHPPTCQGLECGPQDAGGSEDRDCDDNSYYRTHLDPKQAPVGDPFYRALDRALEIEKDIRSKAIEILEIARTEPWKIGGPQAQSMEIEGAWQRIFDSLERTAYELARTEEVTWIW